MPSSNCQSKKVQPPCRAISISFLTSFHGESDTNSSLKFKNQHPPWEKNSSKCFCLIIPSTSTTSSHKSEALQIVNLKTSVLTFKLMISSIESYQFSKIFLKTLTPTSEVPTFLSRFSRQFHPSSMSYNWKKSNNRSCLA